MKTILDLLKKYVNDLEKLASSSKGQEQEKLNMKV
jgi:hypothetical protein